MLLDSEKNKMEELPSLPKEPKFCKLIKQDREKMVITVLFYKEQQPITYHVKKFNETENYTVGNEYYLMSYENDVVTLSP
ncbi:MAG: hypothetical protein NTZ44_03795 [Candidatus Nomurabacteria bacterium]|nr:hypothetical protein [Candidatus Nomurabacteria bacterium]